MSSPHGHRSSSMLGSGISVVRELVSAHPGPFSLAVAGAALYAAATVASTVVLGRATDDVIYPTFATGVIPAGALWWVVAAVLAVAFLRAVGVVGRRYFAGMTSARGERTQRLRLADKYLGLPLSWHQRTPTGRLLAHADNDTETANMVINPLPFTLGTAFLALFSAVSLLIIDRWLALLAFLIFPALTALNRIYSSRIEAPAAEVQAQVGRVSTIAHESFDGALVVKTLGRADAEVDRFDAAADRLRDHRVAVGYTRAFFEAVLDALPNLGIILVVVFGAYRIDAGAITRGELVQVASLFTVLAFPMRVFGFFLESLPPSVVARRRLDLVFDEPDPDRSAAITGLPEGPLDLVVRDLSYRHPLSTQIDDQPDAAIDSEPGSRPADLEDAVGAPAPLVLAGVDLRVEAGEVVALVGSTGSGKSTLCTVLSGLVPPESGVVELGGVPLHNVAPEARADAMALVFQESFLFADTIRANIDLSGRASTADVERAADIAQVAEFVDDLPNGWDTIVGERGVTLSGGQRQRVALARALIRAPRVLLLDDATSAVDPRIEQQILGGLRGGKPVTTLIVAQRVSTIEVADRVLYLSGGRIAAAGTHRELMVEPGYRALVEAYEAARQ